MNTSSNGSNSEGRPSNGRTNGDGHLRYLLTAYLFENISDAGRQEVEEHLAECGECRSELDTLRSTLGLVEDALLHEEEDAARAGEETTGSSPYSFEAHRLERVLAASRERRVQVIPFNFKLDRRWGALAAGLLLFVFGSTFFLQTLGRRDMVKSAADYSEKVAPDAHTIHVGAANWDWAPEESEEAPVEHSEAGASIADDKAGRPEETRGRPSRTRSNRRNSASRSDAGRAVAPTDERTRFERDGAEFAKTESSTGLTSENENGDLKTRLANAESKITVLDNSLAQRDGTSRIISGEGNMNLDYMFDGSDEAAKSDGSIPWTQGSQNAPNISGDWRAYDPHSDSRQNKIAALTYGTPQVQDNTIGYLATDPIVVEGLIGAIAFDAPADLDGIMANPQNGAPPAPKVVLGAELKKLDERPDSTFGFVDRGYTPPPPTPTEAAPIEGIRSFGANVKHDRFEMPKKENVAAASRTVTTPSEPPAGAAAPVLKPGRASVAEPTREAAGEKRSAPTFFGFEKAPTQDAGEVSNELFRGGFADAPDAESFDRSRTAPIGGRAGRAGGVPDSGLSEPKVETGEVRVLSLLRGIQDQTGKMVQYPGASRAAEFNEEITIKDVPVDTEFTVPKMQKMLMDNGLTLIEKTLEDGSEVLEVRELASRASSRGPAVTPLREAGNPDLDSKIVREGGSIGTDTDWYLDTNEQDAPESRDFAGARIRVRGGDVDDDADPFPVGRVGRIKPDPTPEPEEQARFARRPTTTTATPPFDQLRDKLGTETATLAAQPNPNGSIIAGYEAMNESLERLKKNLADEPSEGMASVYEYFERKIDSSGRSNSKDLREQTRPPHDHSLAGKVQFGYGLQGGDPTLTNEVLGEFTGGSSDAFGDQGRAAGAYGRRFGGGELAGNAGGGGSQEIKGLDRFRFADPGGNSEFFIDRPNELGGSGTTAGLPALASPGSESHKAQAEALTQQINKSMIEENYEQAIEIADRLAALDPQNKAAQRLRERAVERRRAAQYVDALEMDEEQPRRTWEDLHRPAIAYDHEFEFSSEDLAGLRETPRAGPGGGGGHSGPGADGLDQFVESAPFNKSVGIGGPDTNEEREAKSAEDARFDRSAATAERLLRSLSYYRAHDPDLEAERFFANPLPIPPPVVGDEGLGRDGFREQFGVNPFVQTEEDALSTFAMDVDTASYTRTLATLAAGALPETKTVRTEEFVNAFPDDRAADPSRAFSVFCEGGPAPFGGFAMSGAGVEQLQITVKARELAPAERRPVILTFAIDTSGSMELGKRLGVVRGALSTLLDQLSPEDRIGIVAYGTQAYLVLPHTSARESDRILGSFDSLTALGSTNVEAGLALAYRIADERAHPRAASRVVLCSDGVATSGARTAEEILKTVRVYADRGIDLSVVGFGQERYDDAFLEQLANQGNGNYAYVNTADDAARLFRDNLPAALSVLARDAKIQVEFDPEVVSQYRLLGYENRDVKDSDFRNDKIDAGEVGPGSTVTAIYEIVRRPASSGSLGRVFLRYHDTTIGQVDELDFPIPPGVIRPTLSETTDRFVLLSGVAEFAELLRDSYFARDGVHAEVIRHLQRLSPAVRQTPEVQALVEGLHTAHRLQMEVLAP